jgi:hypothetical protein
MEIPMDGLGEKEENEDEEVHMETPNPMDGLGEIEFLVIPSKPTRNFAKCKRGGFVAVVVLNMPVSTDWGKDTDRTRSRWAHAIQLTNLTSCRIPNGRPCD